MKKLLLLLPAIALLFSCSSEKNNAAGGKFLSSKVVDKLITEADIFKQDSILKWIDKATRDQITKGKQLYMQGLDLYINQKNAAGAIKLFRESILYYPDPETYTYLGNAYVDTGDTIYADSSLFSLYQPDQNLMYAFARLSALKKDTARAIESLAEAFAYGFSNKKKFENDKIFDYLRSERGFVALVVNYLKNDEKLKETLFKSFLASAPELKLPFVMMKDSIFESDMQAMYKMNSINYDFAAFISGMEDGRFSRDVSNLYFMVGRFDAGNNTQAVIYKSVIIMADTLPPVEVKMATFDSLGNLIEEITFGQFTLPETLLTGTIDENKVITLKESKMKWKKNPLDEGYAGNEYEGEELVSEKKYVINSTGHIVLSADDKVVKK
jgi:tetratricopeptide (TPR) repeat protein